MRLGLVVLVLVGLLAVNADAATRDLDGTAALTQTSPGQYKVTVANTGSTTIGSVVFTAGPALKVSAVTSSNSGTCVLSGSTRVSCTVALMPPPCPCGAGETLELVFTGSGDPGGSTVQLDGMKTITLGTPPTTTPPTQPTPKTKPKAKVPKCKKGQKSTKKKPCRR